MAHAGETKGPHQVPLIRDPHEDADVVPHRHEAPRAVFLANGDVFLANRAAFRVSGAAFQVRGAVFQVKERLRRRPSGGDGNQGE